MIGERIYRPGIIVSLRVAVDALRGGRKYDKLTKLEAANTLEHLRSGHLANARLRKQRKKAQQLRAPETPAKEKL